MANISNEQIIVALMNSGTVKEAAQKIGLSTRSIYNRMDDKDFKAEYAEAKTDLIRQAVFSINGKLSKAIDTVAEIMTDQGVNAAIRLQAAQTILNNAGKFAERLAADEKYAADKRNPSMLDKLLNEIENNIA